MGNAGGGGGVGGVGWWLVSRFPFCLLLMRYDYTFMMSFLEEMLSRSVLVWVFLGRLEIPPCWALDET